MDISSGDMKQSRLVKLAKGVKAAAFSIDEKFALKYGRPELTKANKPSRFSPYRTALITLTYRDGGAYEEGHLSALVKHYREWFRRNGKGETFHYVWVMELTQIGRPHYHMVVWLPRGVRPPLPDQQGWWPHGMTQAVYAYSPIGYITKYASKAETKSGAHLPHRARLWGYGGLRMDERALVSYALAPRWLKGLIHHEANPKKRVIDVEHWGAASGKKLVSRMSAWVLTAGIAAGWVYFSPYDYEGFTGNGISLRHRGHIEVLSPDGDTFHIAHRG